MPQDAELDRLKAVQDQAFKQKQAAYAEMQAAWQRRTDAHTALDRAYQAKQSAYVVINNAWQRYQYIREQNGPRIDRLNSEQESAYQNMKRCFDSSSEAHAARDGAGARYLADQGHDYKRISQECVTERRQLVQEIRNAREAHNATRPAFDTAKGYFDEAKRRHDQAKSEHLKAQEKFKKAKADFTAAAAAFHARLEFVKNQRQNVHSPLLGAVRKAWSRRIVTGGQLQYQDEAHKVKVTSGYSHDKQCITTDIVIADRHNAHQHYHIVLDDKGKVIYQEWRKNR